MKDTELDEILNQWDAPAPRAELRGRVRSGFRAKTTAPRRWFRLPTWDGGKGLFAGLAAGAAMFLLAIGVAFPQSLQRFAAGPIPFLVYSEYIGYNDDGSSVITKYARTFERDGHEWILDASFPGSAWQTAHIKLISSLHLMFYELLRPFQDVQPAGKGCEGWTAYGHETLLGYQTTIIRTTFTEGRENYRFTKWVAPALSCATLKTTYEQLRADGTARLVDERRALNVIMNH
jgi:hypothetical protein